MISPAVTSIQTQSASQIGSHRLMPVFTYDYAKKFVGMVRFLVVAKRKIGEYAPFGMLHLNQTR